jgi:hypothetical protein
MQNKEVKVRREHKDEISTYRYCINEIKSFSTEEREGGEYPFDKRMTPV